MRLRTQMKKDIEKDKREYAKALEGQSTNGEGQGSENTEMDGPIDQSFYTAAQEHIVVSTRTLLIRS